MKKSPKDIGTQVVVLAKQAGALVKAKPPTWRDFNRFVADFDELKEYYDEIVDAKVGRAEYPRYSTDYDDEDAERCQELVTRCEAGLERFDRRDNYDDPDDDESPLGQEHIAKRVGVMIASFPNANPSSPEGYVQMLIEHVGAVEGLTEPALESACREIVETQKFAPAIAEVMPIVNEHVDRWFMRKRALHNVRRVRLETIKELIEREQKQQKEAREEEIKQATHAAQRAKVRTQLLAKEYLNAQSKLGQLHEQHEAVENVLRATIAKLVEEHAEAEKRESEANSKLQALIAESQGPPVS